MFVDAVDKDEALLMLLASGVITDEQGDRLAMNVEEISDR